MIKKSLTLSVLLLMQTSYVIGMERQLEKIVYQNNYYYQQQEHKKVQFVQVHDDSDQPYLARLAHAAQKGPLSVAEQGTAMVIMWGLQNLKDTAFPDPEVVLKDSLELSNFTNQSIELSNKFLPLLKRAILRCPNNDDKDMYLGYYDEIEEKLLSSNFYKQQGKKAIYTKLAKLNKILEVDVPLIGKTGEKLLKSKTETDKEYYGRLYQANLSTTLKSLHATVCQDDNSFDMKQALTIGGSAIAGVAAVAVGITIYRYV